MTNQAREKVETFGWEHAKALMMVGAAVARRAWPSDCKLFSSHRGTAASDNLQWRMEVAGIMFARAIDSDSLGAEDWYLVGTRPEYENEKLPPFPNAYEVAVHKVGVLTRDLAITRLQRDKAMTDRDEAIADRDEAIAERDKAVGRAFSLEDVVKGSRAKLDRAQQSLKSLGEERRLKRLAMTLEDIMLQRWK